MIIECLVWGTTNQSSQTITYADVHAPCFDESLLLVNLSLWAGNGRCAEVADCHRHPIIQYCLTMREEFHIIVDQSDKEKNVWTNIYSISRSTSHIKTSRARCYLEVLLIKRLANIFNILRWTNQIECFIWWEDNITRIQWAVELQYQYYSCCAAVLVVVDSSEESGSATHCSDERHTQRLLRSVRLYMTPLLPGMGGILNSWPFQPTTIFNPYQNLRHTSSVFLQTSSDSGLFGTYSRHWLQRSVLFLFENVIELLEILLISQDDVRLWLAGKICGYCPFRRVYHRCRVLTTMLPLPGPSDAKRAGQN